MASVPTPGRAPPYANYGLWALIIILTLVLQAGDQLPSWQFDRSAIDAGRYYLLLSAHYVHAGWPHWLLNMTGLVMVGYFFSPYARLVEWLVVLLICSLSAGLGVYLFDPALVTGSGLSAVLHGLFMFGALREIRHHPVSGYVLLSLLVGKLVWEFVLGPLPGSEDFIGGQVATGAHLYGALGGGVAFAFLKLLTLRIARTPTDS